MYYRQTALCYRHYGRRDRIILSCHQVQNNVFSSNILFFSLRASHSGSYTCIATNKAAAVNFTAQLIVRGAFSLFALLAAES